MTGISVRRSELHAKTTRSTHALPTDPPSFRFVIQVFHQASLTPRSNQLPFIFEWRQKRNCFLFLIQFETN